MQGHDLSVVFAVVASFLSYSFGVNPAIEFLLWAVCLDVVIGVMASFVNEKLMFNSRKMFRGLVKKLVLLSLVAFAHQLDNMLHLDIIETTTIYFFMANEALSCLENAGKCGLQLPKILYDSLEQVKTLGGEKHDNKKSKE